MPARRPGKPKPSLPVKGLPHPATPAIPRAQPTPKPKSTPVPTHWDHVAPWYEQLVGEHGSEYQRHVVIPGVLRLLNLPIDPLGRGKPTAALRVLDLACGQGVLCRALASRGCDVVGIDAAPSLIEAARARAVETGNDSPRYAVADVTRLDEATGLADESFDAITCVLAIQNIAVLSPVWRSCARLLKAQGRLVVVMMHPCFRIPQASHWGWDPAATLPAEPAGSASKPSRKPRPPAPGLEYRRIDRYLSSRKTPIRMHPGSDPGAVTLHFHRPLQAYVNTLGDAGLCIDHLAEWPGHKISDPSDPKAAAHDHARREIPMFLALRARKG